MFAEGLLDIGVSQIDGSRPPQSREPPRGFFSHLIVCGMRCYVNKARFVSLEDEKSQRQLV